MHTQIYISGNTYIKSIFFSKVSKKIIKNDDSESKGELLIKISLLACCLFINSNRINDKGFGKFKNKICIS